MTRLCAALLLGLLLTACYRTTGAGATESDATAAANPAPDLIVHNARVYLDGSSLKYVQAFAVSAGRFTAVGSEEEVVSLAGPETQFLDVGGQSVLPGLLDGHVHPFQGGEKLLYSCNFAFSASPEEVAAAVRACADDPDAPEWIVGGQWNSDFFVDNAIESPRAFLDAVSGDHPVFLEDDSAHHGWANSKALELAGVTAESPDPEGGVFLRDADGAPNGVLLEYASIAVSRVIPRYSFAQQVDAIAEAARIANGYGVTGWGEARAPEQTLAAYQQADRDGRLNVHSLLYQQSYGRGMNPEPLEPVEAFIARAERYQSANIDSRAIKFFLDGVPTASRSALMLEPYTVDAQHPESTHGMQMIPRDELFDAVASFDAAGFRIKIHTAGDGSVRLALDAIEHARRVNGDSGIPHSLAHAGYVSETDIPRFAALNAVADFTPYLWYPRPIVRSVVQAVGLPRGTRYWPTRDLLAAGAPINGGSDWPAAAADMNPWPAIEALVTRRHPDGGSDEAFWPEQAVSLDEAITLWTTRPADIMGMGQETGSIAVGKSADFIVLDRDFHAMPVADISDLIPVSTWFRGREVFRRSAL